MNEEILTFRSINLFASLGDRILAVLVAWLIAPWTMDRTVETNCWFGATSWYRCIVEKWGFQRCQSLPCKSGCLTVMTELSRPKPNFAKIALIKGRFDKIDEGFNFLSNCWVSLLFTQGLKHGNICNSWFITPNSKFQIQKSKFE